MPSPAIHPKTSCAVIGCNRTSRCFPNEWVCGRHWRLVDRSLKRFRTKRLREISRLIARLDALTFAAQARLPPPPATDELVVAEIYRWAWKAVHARARWRRLELAIWRRMKRQAIERAAGL